MKPIASSLAALALVVLVAGVALSSPTSNPVAPQHNAFSASASSPTALPELAAPHCCASGASTACRDLCKQQGPACKGTIGCRAGECVCTCSCP